ncbi:adenylate/guanylate cyclase domain-containing protein [Olivibacter sitiensis]|uniref:adenylate/guanylate cyclase domain-containing protein n=1 Tax=Olivibacter sitiensis TaxID=376470 RepID=UPI0004031669|nr:adenylate/guanylate cyclase domain-containing protein [Olivibacter sitiensis]
MKQMGASEIYLNSHLIDSIGKIDTLGNAVFKSAKTNPTILVLNDTLVNVLAIRYQVPINENIEHKDTGFIEVVNESEDDKGDPGFRFFIQNTDTYLSNGLGPRVQANYIVGIIMGVFFALGFIHFLLFCFYPKVRYNFFFAIYNLSISLIAYIVLRSLYKEDIPLTSNLEYWVILGFSAFSFSLTGFVNTLFGRSKIRHIILLFIPLIAVVIMFFNMEIAGWISGLHLLFVIFEAFYLIIRAMFRKEKSAFIIGSGLLMFFLLTLIIWIGELLGVQEELENLLGEDKFYFSLFLIISFPISISAYLAWQYAAVNVSLQKQLTEVQRLSELSVKQEQEKQQILQDQNKVLEEQVTERTAELQLEKQKADDLLLNILPQEVANELKAMGTTKAQHYDEVTVIFTDFVNFTENSERWGAETMLRELNTYFTAFDHIMEKHGLEKIKTIGDAYLAVCGLPHQNPDHARTTVLAALDILQHVHERKLSEGDALDIRIGIHSGPLIAGIVGVKKFAYDIWGDTVNTAARMEQTSLPGRINISEDTYQLVKDYFIFEPRGRIRAKGKGDLNMYFVNAPLVND